MSSANDKQVGGSHYKNQTIQTWDFVMENDIPFIDGMAIKYIARWRDKGGVRDLEKAIHCIEKLIDIEHSTDTGAHSPGTVPITKITVPT